MKLPNMPSITTQSVFNAVVMAVVVGGTFYVAKLGASKMGGTVQQTVEKVADLAGQ